MPKFVPVKSKPSTTFKILVQHSRTWLNQRYRTASQWARQNWFRLLIIGLLTFILLEKDVRFQLDLQNSTAIPLEQLQELVPFSTVSDQHQSSTAAPVLDAATEKQAAYVQRFAKVAQQEMSTFGIPASITLAQGLLETNAGESPLANEHNNHFGLKCFSRSCKKGHCANFSDDSHKDFFRKFTSAWESYRAHSLLLANSERYEELFKLPKTDYGSWATGLKKAGYATDRRYDQKLVKLIEALRLYEYDV